MTTDLPHSPRPGHTVGPRVRSTGEFVSSLFEAATQGQPLPNHYWFRGHATTDWKLRPVVEREDFKKAGDSRQKAGISKSATHFEQSILFRFLSLHADLGLSVGSGLDMYIRARHAGLPTRLLDWTYRPLVALYFAVSGAHTDEDAIVYGLNVEEYARSCFAERKQPLQAAIRSANHDQGLLLGSLACSPQTADSEILQRLISAITNSLFSQVIEDSSILSDPRLLKDCQVLGQVAFLFPFVPMMPTGGDIRARAQGSRFTLHLPSAPLEIICRKHFADQQLELAFEPLEKSNLLDRWVIPAEAKPTILRELRTLGISRPTLFLDSDSIASEVKAMNNLNA